MTRAWLALGSMLAACAGCFVAMTATEIDQQRAIARNSAWTYRADASAEIHLLAYEDYCLACVTLEEHGLDAGDAGIVCPDGGN